MVRGLTYVQCNAEALPFPDASFDLVTIAFGLRNVTDKDAALREMQRVLKVGGRWDGHAHHALLAGDIEREQELALVATQRAALAAEVLLVPHHGSKTSSSEGFLDAVAPRFAVVQAGYRNRFGHPAPAVAARYAARGIELIDSPRCGAWRFGPGGSSCWRALSRRYWHHPDGAAPASGLEVANSLPAADDAATED